MACSSTYCFLNVPMFKALKPEHFELVANMITQQDYEKGEYIAFAGDRKKNLFVIQSGSVKIIKPLTNGQDHIVRIAASGEFFGDISFLNNQPIPTNIEALEHTKICAISGDDLKAFFLENPEVLLTMATEMSIQMDKMSQNIGTLIHKDVATRVAKFLIDFRYNQPIKISKKDIADYLGTTRESVSRKLSEFQRKQWIAIEKNGISIQNEAALHAFLA